MMNYKDLGITKFLFPKWTYPSEFYNLGEAWKYTGETLKKKINLILEINKIEEGWKNVSIAGFEGDIIVLIRNCKISLESGDISEGIPENRLKQIKYLEKDLWKNKGLSFYSLGDINNLPLDAIISNVNLFLDLNQIPPNKAQIFELNENEAILCIEGAPNSLESFNKEFSINPVRILPFEEPKRDSSKIRTLSEIKYQNALKEEKKSQILFEVEGFFSKDTMPHIYVDIFITPNGFEFYGKKSTLLNLEDSTGYHMSIPWGRIADIQMVKTKMRALVTTNSKKSKYKNMYVTIITAIDKRIYAILPIYNQSDFTKMNESTSKQNCRAFLQAIDEAKRK